MRRLVIGERLGAWCLKCWRRTAYDFYDSTRTFTPWTAQIASGQRNLLLGDSWVFTSLYPTIILFYQMPDILGTALQIQISSNNMFVLQLQIIATTCCNESPQYYFHIPQIAALEGVFFGLKSCVGRWAPGSVDTGALFYVACSHFAILRFVSLTYTQLYFYRWKTNKEARRQTLPDVDILQELGDIMKTKSVKFSPNTLYIRIVCQKCWGRSTRHVCIFFQKSCTLRDVEV